MNTINNFLNEICAKNGTKTAFKFLKGGDVYSKTYLELESDTTCFASYLSRIYGNENKMAIISATSYEWFMTYFAIAKSKNCAVTLDYTLDAEKLSEMINFSDTNVLFISEAFKDSIEIYKKNCPGLKDIFIMEKDLDDFLIVNYGLENDFDDETVGQIIFTSGTTGKNKAVMLTHKNLTCLYHYGIDKFNSKLVSMSVLPVHHVAELINGTFHMLISGGTVCINDKIENLMTNLQIFKPYVMTVVPLIMNKFAMAAAKVLKDANIPDAYLENMTLLERRRMFAEFNKKVFGGNMICLIVGGSAMDSEMAKILEKVGIRVTQGYGLTESTAVIAGNEFLFNNVETCGTIYIKDLTYKIVDGELVVKGPNVMKGYYKDEEETKNAFTEDGYLKTGDLVSVDEKGYIKIVGRKKNLIILTNGENVSPEELQELVARNPYAMQNIVYDDKDNLCCAVYLENASDEQKTSILNTVEKINMAMPAYKRIVKTNFVTKPFVVTSKNSVKRKETIKNILEELNSVKVIEKPENENETKLYEYIKSLLKEGTEFSVTDSIFDYGVDSLLVLEIAAKLDISAQDIYNKKTVREIAKIMNVERIIENDDEANVLVNANKNIEYLNVKNNYFITGASGFFGCYITHELVKQKKKVYVLVRNKTKFVDTYKKYFNENVDGKVEVFVGDVRYENFGLDLRDISYLKTNVKHVIHSAAIVKHVGDEKTFMAINVDGTKNAINFAKTCKAAFHYISSYSVSGFGLTKQNTSGVVFDENVLNIGQDYKSNIYVYTKYLAEKEVLKARHEGMLANIYRVGSLSWGSDGTFQINEEENGLYNRLLGMLKSGIYNKEDVDSKFDLTPVDECSKAFTILLQSNHINNIYHLFNPNVVGVSDFEKIYGKEFEGVDREYFKELSKETDDKNIKFYADYQEIMYSLNGNMFDCTFTAQKLYRKGFAWSKIDDKYLKAKIS